MKKIARKLLSFSMGSAVFSGLPFVGWGLGDPQGFLQNSARAGYVLMMLVLMILVVLFVPEEGRGERSGEKAGKQAKMGGHTSANIISGHRHLRAVLRSTRIGRHG
jgi:hypothetical protein